MSLPASADRLLVSERFVSLQGEGVSTGAPAAFLRLGNCNLSCNYCDTPYSWDSRRFDLSQELHAISLLEVADWVVDHAPGRLIITGGEPLLQHKLIVPLLCLVDERTLALGRERTVVEIETNATILPSAALLARIDQWNVSPKLSFAGDELQQRIKPQVIARFAELTHAYFKFVVRSLTDVSEVQALIEQFSLNQARVQLMPEARDPAELKERAQLVASWALSARIRYSGRLHLELYGGRRGT